MEYLKIGLCILLIIRVVGYIFDPKTYRDDALEFLHVVGTGLSIAALILALSYLLTGSRDTYFLMCAITFFSVFTLMFRRVVQ